ncbi:Uncharacterised protein [Yersinia massiliensis]|nr:Uncharacterised protein [Yersinia massiliensis]
MSLRIAVGERFFVPALYILGAVHFLGAVLGEGRT